MTTRKYSSRSQQTTLTGALNTTATSVNVVSASALMGGASVSGGQTFTVVINPDTAVEEIVDVTAVSSNTLTITRGVENAGTGQSHSAGAVVRHMAIGRDFTEANQHIEASTNVHGLAAGVSVVGDTATQTLTNKTLTSPKINENVALTATATELNVLDGITSSTAELNILDGVTATAAELNILDGVTSSAAELNILDGATLSTTELNYVDGVTSAIQTQLDGKQPVISGVSNTEIGYLDGVTSAIQTQLDSKAPTANPTFTGTVTLPSGTVTSDMIANATIVNADVSATAAIAKTKLDLGGTITSADIVDGTIVASDIADGTITAAKLVADPFARANHTGSQAASTISDLATTVKAYTLDEFADPAAAISMNSQKITTLATPTDNADAATKLYVDTKVADLVNSAPSTLDTLGEIASAIQSGGTVYESFVLKAGSTMTGALTLSGAPTVDLHAATKAYVDTVAGSATAAAASAAAAAASYDSFDDRYLGAKATAPSVDNDGNALVTGAIYWDTVSNAMYAWTGSEWGSISSTAAIYRYRFTASGGETSLSGTDANGLTLSYLPGKEQVYLNGVLLARTSDYTASNGTSITSLAALAASDIVEIITFTSFELATALVSGDIDAKGDLFVGTAADTVGKLTVGTDGQVLTADSSTSTGLTYTTPITASSTTTLTNKTLSLTNNTVSGTLAQFNTALSGDDFVSLTGDETLTNKTLTNAKINLAFDAETASYTAVLANNSQVVTMDNASANTFSIPTNASVAFPIGTQINVLQIGAGQTTIQAVTSGTTTIQSTGAAAAAPKLRARYSAATCIKAGTDLWYVIGDIA